MPLTPEQKNWLVTQMGYSPEQYDVDESTRSLVPRQQSSPQPASGVTTYQPKLEGGVRPVAQQTTTGGAFATSALEAAPGAILGGIAPVAGKSLNYAFGGGAKQAAGDLIQNVGTKLSESQAAKEAFSAATPEAQTAMNRGISPSDVKLLHTLTPEELQATQKMMDIKDANLSGTNQTHQPIEVAGNEIMNQANHLAGVQESSGKQLNDIVSSMPNTPQDTTGIANNFLDDLQKNHNVPVLGLTDIQSIRYHHLLIHHQQSFVNV